MNAKSLGIFGLLVVLFVFMVIMTSEPWYDFFSSTFLQPNNIENLLRRVSMYGLLGIGVAFVIITGGIDLSVGSIVCLAGCLLGIFLQVDYRPADNFDVYKATEQTQTLIVHGNATDVLAAEDKLRLYRGRQPAILTVRSVEAVQLADRAGKPIGVGSVLEVEGLPRDDDAGQVAKAFDVKNFGNATDDDLAWVELENVPFPLAPKDRVAFFHPTRGLKELVVRSSKRTGQVSRVEFSQPLGANFSKEWMAMPTERKQRMPIPLAILSVLGIASCLGLVHGLLVTRVHLQPFVVTLCGLLIYRGISRWLVDDNPVGFGIEYKDTLSPLGSGKLSLFEWSTADGTQTFGIPYPFFVFLAVSIVAAVFLNLTIWGRYMLALGSNEEAARYSGIRTQRVTILAYVICTVAAATGGMLFALDSGSISPSSFGNFYELYAIAAAVLGGCSLRGGE
ncbi:MAG: ABC transporter permease, partial [Rubripirellula sp.]